MNVRLDKGAGLPELHYDPNKPHDWPESRAKLKKKLCEAIARKARARQGEPPEGPEHFALDERTLNCIWKHMKDAIACEDHYRLRCGVAK